MLPWQCSWLPERRVERRSCSLFRLTGALLSDVITVHLPDMYLRVSQELCGSAAGSNYQPSGD